MITNPTGPDLIIVGCGQKKQDHAAPAQDLYTSQYFRAKRQYAEQSGCPWMIASAEHGLVMPGEVVEPYDCSLAGLDDNALWWWRWKVRRAVRGLAFEPTEKVVVELHAGAMYREQLRGAIRRVYQLAEFVEPCAGIGIGEQLAWYKLQGERRAA